MNLQAQYRRNTHDENGDYRNLPDWHRIPNNLSSVVHSLSPVEWLYLYEIMSEIYSYAKDFPLENDIDLFGNPATVELVLELLVNFDMVQKR